MSERISVTEVRNALRCPRIFALGRRNGRAVAFPVGSSLLGGAFHAIVDRFARAVSDPPPAFAALPAKCARDEVDAALVRWLLEGLVDWLEREPASASMPQEIDDLAEALRQLAGHLAARVVTFDARPADALREVLRESERALGAELSVAGGESIVVEGRLDALFGTARGSLEVVEYKLTDEANDLLDRAQVALYRQILRASEGLDARPVARFTPMLRETSMDAASADAFFGATLAAARRDDDRGGRASRAPRPRRPAPTSARAAPSAPIARRSIRRGSRRATIRPRRTPTSRRRARPRRISRGRPRRAPRRRASSQS
ncbi:MAG: PD-(D/E)XK nuclease family protein [Polyangiaceae bacterium]